MKIAIVGSRSFPQLKLVEQFIKDLPAGVVLVSGGAKGVDATAREMAKRYGLEFIEHLPDLEGCEERYEFTQRYYARNQKIVDDSDLVVAFTEKETGGTWDTIKKAKRKGIPVKIIKPFLMFPGVDDPTEDDEPEVEVNETRSKGKGPFHLRRITLGSFALKLKRYYDKLDLADLVNMKEDDPEKFCETVLPFFLEFFEKYPPGVIHAVTTAPRSKRNLDRIHPMDLVRDRLAESLGCKSVDLFAPWEKPRRGVRGWEGQIEVTQEIKKYVGKVVYIIDDFVTTGQTLQKACRALTSLEIHTHGIAYLMWS